MKIALCFSGQIRDLLECSTNIHENIIKGNDVDVFMHGWWDKKLENKRYKPNSTRFAVDADKVFEEIYEPTKTKFEKQKEFDFSKYDFNNLGVTKNPTDARRCIYHMTSMWYSVNESFKLAQSTGKEYDFYVRCRTDLVFKYPINFKKLNKDVLYIGDGRTAGADRHYSDWFACGNKKNMAKYNKIYDNLYELNKSGVLHMHNFVKYFLEKKKKIECDTSSLAPHLYYFWKESGWLNDWLSSLGKNTFSIPKKKSNQKDARFGGDNNF